MLHEPDEPRTTAPWPRMRGASGRAVAVLGGIYCWVTAGTTPFTLGADVAVGAALALAAILVTVEAAAGAPWRPSRSDRTGRAGTLWPWWVPIAALVAWELFNYTRSPRHSYPTVSSVYDHVARWRWAKAELIGAWLVLGREIVASFAKAGARR